MPGEILHFSPAFSGVAAATATGAGGVRVRRVSTGSGGGGLQEQK